MLHPFGARAGADQAHLRLLATTDLHVDAFPCGDRADEPNDTLGLVPPEVTASDDARPVILAAPDTDRDVIVRFVHDRGTVDPRADGNWRLAPVPDTAVTFEAGPGARAHLGEVEGVTIEEAGPAENGFARFRVRL